MPKLISCPVKHWGGSVLLCDPLTYPQVIALEDALEAVTQIGERPSQARVNYALLPGLLPCVEKWQLGNGFPESPAPDNFPANPKIASALLIKWLLDEMIILYNEAEEVPNG